MATVKWDFKQLSTGRYETNRHELGGAFQSIRIETDTADVRFVPSESAGILVECYEQIHATHTVEICDGVLVVELADTRKWYEHIGIFFDSPKITVAIPQGEYEALTVKNDTGDVTLPKDFRFHEAEISTDTGDISVFGSVNALILKASTGALRVEGIDAQTMELSVTTGGVQVSSVACKGDVSVRVSTGKATLRDLSCQNLSSEGKTGDISLQNVIADGSLSIKRSTGAVKLDRCDAAEILIHTSTGDVKGSVLSEKVFLAYSDTGRVRVPSSIQGGRCEIHTSTGNITMEILAQ